MTPLVLLAVLAQGSPLRIDLATPEHAARTVIVDREEGQYLGHPTTVLLEDGRTILAVYPKGHGRGAIVYKRSTDGGRTWSERLPTPESWATSLETPTIHRLVDREGTRRLILFSGLYPVRRAVSEDDGRTWSELEPVGDWGGIVAMASVVPVAGGDHLAFFHDDGRFLHEGGKAEGRFQLLSTRSTDGGLTWSEPRVLLESIGVHLCEPGAVRSPDGKELTLLLRENRRAKTSQGLTSHDEGESWTESFALSPALTGDRHVARYAPDGRLVVTFRDMAQDSPTHGDWVAWVGRYEDVRNHGDGQYRVRLADNHHQADCGYPGLELLPDGTFVAVSYGHWTPDEPPYVIAVRFTLAELDALAPR